MKRDKEGEKVKRKRKKIKKKERANHINQLKYFRLRISVCSEMYGFFEKQKINFMLHGLT